MLAFSLFVGSNFMAAVARPGARAPRSCGWRRTGCSANVGLTLNHNILCFGKESPQPVVE